MRREVLWTMMVNMEKFRGAYIHSIELEDGSGYSFNVRTSDGKTHYVRCIRPS